jgi:hypothetical protein
VYALPAAQISLPPLSGRQLQRLALPDLVGVLADRAVGGERAHGGYVAQGFDGPGLFTLIGHVHLLLRGDVPQPVRR